MFNKPTIIMGPATASAGKTTIIHEYLHGIIGPILTKYRKEVDEPIKWLLFQIQPLSKVTIMIGHQL